MKKISFISTNKSIDVKNWSGTEYYVAQTLEKHFQLNYLTGLNTNIFTKATLKKFLYKRNGGYSITRSPEVAKDYAKQIMRRLDKKTDIIFSTSSIPIGYIDANIPKAFYTDATYAQILNYYKEASGLSPQTIKEGMALEQRALDSSNLVFYSSDWAANSAINDYGISPDKVKVIPFGANTKKILPLEEIKLLVNKKSDKVCKILFLGVDWERKRGDLVVQSVKYLNEVLNLPTELHIAGIKELPLESLPPYIYNYGFISKAEPGGTEKIEKLIAESHFLFVPSKMEAYGLVFCEAMSFGVPCISSETGGIPTIIKNGMNGYILPINSSSDEYALQIYNAFQNKKEYRELSISAYNDFSSRLNWDVAGERLKKYLNDL